jgi:hypothetical protein
MGFLYIVHFEMVSKAIIEISLEFNYDQDLSRSDILTHEFGDSSIGMIKKF